MTEWELILEERKEDMLDQENAKVISKILEGRRTPTRAAVVRALTQTYSEYGKRRND